MTKSHGPAVQPRFQRPRRALGVLTVVALLGLGLAAGPAGAATASPNQYVALGDSTASGVFIWSQLNNPLGCWRSDHNYAHDAAATLGLTLTDMTCAAATIANMTAPQVTGYGTNPAELSAVTSSTQVVSLSIGALDVGFADITANCASFTPWGFTRVGFTCTPHYTVGGDKIAAAITTTAPKIAAILQAIHQQAAPNVKIFVVGYPAPVPATGSGCWPNVPITQADVPYIRQVMAGLGRMLGQVAAANDATYVDVYTPSLGYSACAPQSARWVEPIIPIGAYPLHANANGMAHIADLLVAAMQSAGVTTTR